MPVAVYVRVFLRTPPPPLKYGIFWNGDVTVSWRFAKTHQLVIPVNAFLIPVAW